MRAERDTVFYGCVTLIAAMFHQMSRYSTGVHGGKGTLVCHLPRDHRPSCKGSLDRAFLPMGAHVNQGKARPVSFRTYGNDVLIILGSRF